MGYEELYPVRLAQHPENDFARAMERFNHVTLTDSLMHEALWAVARVLQNKYPKAAIDVIPDNMALRISFSAPMQFYFEDHEKGEICNSVVVRIYRRPIGLIVRLIRDATDSRAARAVGDSS
jgi:hypothetical protein